MDVGATELIIVTIIPGSSTLLRSKLNLRCSYCTKIVYLYITHRSIQAILQIFRVSMYYSIITRFFNQASAATCSDI